MENKIMLRNFKMKVDSYSQKDLAKFYWLFLAVLLVFYVLGWQGQSRERSEELATFCNENLHVDEAPTQPMDNVDCHSNCVWAQSM